MSDQPPRSAFEIAMERLRQKDAADGIERRPPTDRQKTAIAEVRSIYEARLAQEEVMHKSTLMRMVDPSERTALEEEYQRSRARLVAERDRKVDQIRSGEADT